MSIDLEFEKAEDKEILKQKIRKCCIEIASEFGIVGIATDSKGNPFSVTVYQNFDFLISYFSERKVSPEVLLHTTGPNNAIWMVFEATASNLQATEIYDYPWLESKDWIDKLLNLAEKLRKGDNSREM
jgi:hypothetical protein